MWAYWAKDRSVKCIGNLCLAAVVVMGWSCDSSEYLPPTEVVDLDNVLDTFTDTMGMEESDSSAPPITPIEPGSQEGEAQTDAFMTQFAQALNESSVSQQPVGVAMREDGVIEGYADRNSDGTRTAEEPVLFDIEIDADQNRVIASQTVEGDTYHRDHGYFPGGIFTGYLIGSMLGRQMSYGAGPRYANTRMSPRNYHTRAVSRAQSKFAARSARARGGTSGFRGGK